MLSERPRFFSARFMGRALAVLVLLGGALGGYELESLAGRNAGIDKMLLARKQSLDDLRLATQRQRAQTAPIAAALDQELKSVQAELLQQDRTLAGLQEGFFGAGEGHAARLALVARSVPATAWVTLIKVDGERFDIGGFTFDPEALNSWIAQLEASPLLSGQKLAAVDVTKVVEPAGTAADAARPLWSFSLITSRERPAIAAEVSR